MGCGNDARTLPPTNAPYFHTFACRHQPACAIAMKECPGPRSVIDRCGSLSFAIRGIPSSIRPPIRHSGEGRNPEGAGKGKTTRRWKKLTRRPIFILRPTGACGLGKKSQEASDRGRHAAYPDTWPGSMRERFLFLSLDGRGLR